MLRTDGIGEMLGGRPERDDLCEASHAPINTFVAHRCQRHCSAAKRYTLAMHASERLNQARDRMEERPLPSRAEIARRARLNATTVRAYFNGERPQPPLDACEDLGRVLGVSPKWLFNGKGPMTVAALEPANDGVRMTRVPLIDSVAAGRLTSPSSQVPLDDLPLLYFADLGPGDYFATRVDGNSMDRLSPHGSIVIVNRRDTTLISGRCYLFAWHGETTYKRWQGGDPAYLEPFSTDAGHKPIFVKRKTDLLVIGRVRRTVLDL